MHAGQFGQKREIFFWRGLPVQEQWNWQFEDVWPEHCAKFVLFPPSTALSKSEFGTVPWQRCISQNNAIVSIASAEQPAAEISGRWMMKPFYLNETTRPNTKNSLEHIALLDLSANLKRGKANASKTHTPFLRRAQETRFSSARPAKTSQEDWRLESPQSKDAR